MKKLSFKQEQMMRKAIEFAPLNQIFVWLFWDIFNKRKSEKLISCIENGMSWTAAYHTSKSW